MRSCHPPSPISALPATAPTTTHAARRAEARKTADTTTPTADSASPAARSGAALQPPTSAPTATPNAGFGGAVSPNGGTPRGRGRDGPAFSTSIAANKGAGHRFRRYRQVQGERADPRAKRPSRSPLSRAARPPARRSAMHHSRAPSSGACIASTLKLRDRAARFSGLPGTVTKILYIQ